MRIKLYFQDIQEIQGGKGMSVIVLTDEQEQRALTVVCDEPMTGQFRQRHVAGIDTSAFLPEVLVGMLRSYDELELELNIYDIADGQYKVTLLNRNTLVLQSIRMSDAVLLNRIADVPIYIDERLMARQCSSYVKGETSLSIPINTLSKEKLEEALRKAIEVENYHLASHLRDELKAREKSSHEGE